MYSLMNALGRGLRGAAIWLSGRSLAHFFFVTRHLEREVGRLRTDNEHLRAELYRAQQQTAEQAARFAEERKTMLDRFVPVIEQKPTAPPEPDDEWAALSNELGLNPIDRKIKAAQRAENALWEERERLRRQQAIWGETLDEVQADEAEDEAALRSAFAERARKAALNEAGAV